MLPPTARVVSSLRALVCPLFVLISFLPTSAQSLPDATYPSLTVQKLAFGSCHSRKASTCYIEPRARQFTCGNR